MQSQYGVPEMQQFMADGGCSPVFSIGTADMQVSSQAQKQQHHHHGHHLQHPHQHPHQQHQQQAQRQLHHHQHLHLHHHLPQMQLQQPVALPPPQAFQHFHPIPVTQQLFQHGPQFQLFQQEQQRRIHQQLVHLGLEIESGPESSSSPTRSIIPAAAGSGGGGIPPFLGGASFKLAVNENSGGGDSRDRLNDDEGILQGDEGSDTHIHLWNTTREEEPGIKEPFWRPLDVDYINRNNKRCKEKQAEPADSGKHCKSGREGENVDDGNNSASNYKLFSELEAIYKPVGGGGDGSGSSSLAVLNNNQQTGSGSALTGENPQAMAAEPQVDWGHTTEDADQGSDTSTGEEAAQIDKPNKSSGGSSGGRRKRKRKQQLSSIASFFESLVKRLMEHQEGLHRKFLEVLDRRDQERINREELWRQQEAAKTTREATARAQEQALASTREAAIISFLEKITGESLNLPTREQFQSQLPEESSQKEGPKHADQPDAYAVAPVDGSDADVNHNSGNADPGIVNPSRWPKAEVQALIRVRSSLEARFQEPGLKGPLWEEVSATMASIGYQRSAKRCKEKWENINKYFRKTKDSPKKRSQHSKTCPYFHQLDQLYSKSLNKAATQQAGAAAATPSTGRRDSSELLDALVVPNELQSPSLRFPDVDAARQLESGSNKGDADDIHEASGSATAGRRDMEDGEDGEGDEEGEGDSQEQAARSRGRDDGRPEHHDHSPRDVAVFSRRLES
ncbi:hypothetical protein Taro_035606 [Colocasia esculenta]|uniref:Myb-like domain-containing protein n=1 Tax=Colocasia esculenta TaxID=4460 RepID=A0A843VZD1_COLES|nr:hypothetical protein [Colocasia esculenta]